MVLVYKQSIYTNGVRALHGRAGALFLIRASTSLNWQQWHYSINSTQKDWPTIFLIQQ